MTRAAHGAPEQEKETDMDYNDLTPEQKARAEACKTTDELIALAKEEGLELTDAQLEAVAGGSWKTICTDNEPPMDIRPF